MISKSSISSLSLDQLKSAVHLKEQIAVLEGELAALLAGTALVHVAAPVSGGGGRGGKRNLSPEARERIANAQRTRWAKFHAQRSGSVRKTRKSKKHGAMSAEGRARIVAAQKARWARFRAGRK